MIIPSVPEDPKVLEAIGAVSVRHGQLDYALRMTIKRISEIGLEAALDATEGKGSSDLRRLIRKMARPKLGEASNSYLLLEALLNRSHRSTQRRNELLHGLWAFDLDEGREVFRHSDKQWQDIPQAEDLTTLADEMANLANELHEARLNGFLKEALLVAKEP